MSVRRRETASSGEAGRRILKRRSLDEKRRIVEETLIAGASVSVVARRHDVNANQVFAWRRLYRCGELGGSTTETALVKVGVIGHDGIVFVPEKEVTGATSSPSPAPCRDGQPAPHTEPRSIAAVSLKPPKMIEVELRGGSRIRIDADVKGAALQQVLKLIRALA
jgi:transposase-like protein